MKRKFDLDHLCQLANLELPEREKNNLTSQLEKIVNWVNKLEELKLEVNTEETHLTINTSIPLRSDEPTRSFSPKEAIANSSESEKNFIKVPKVIEGK
ncbi:MAG: Asp-tRNA(Asn)/Glu-tRNA(Gln) amidotransferase subunit GatC [Candidatus Aminicenantia bacterium]